MSPSKEEDVVFKQESWVYGRNCALTAKSSSTEIEKGEN